MVSVVRSLLVPGVGSAKKALSTINKLRDDMNECDELCGRLLCRLLETYKQLREMEKKDRAAPREALDQYARLLGKCVVFMKQHPAKPLFERVLQQRKTLDEIQRLHEVLDAITQELGITTMAWKERWEQDTKTHAALLTMVIDNRECVEYEVGDVRTQIEAMTVLKFELEQRGEDHTREQRDMIQKLCKQIQLISDIEDPAVPGWYIPSSDVVYDITPFTHCCSGSLHSGRWNSRVVVVMTLTGDLTARTGASARERLIEMIDRSYQLLHPHVVKIAGANHVASPPFIVLEATSTGTLTAYLESLDTDQGSLKWWSLYEAALGLEYLHNNGVVHGDLTMDNILIGDDGVAQIVSPVASGSITHAASLRWRAPECLQHRPTYASDVYSLGQCILQAVTGEPLFAFLDDAMVYCFVRDGKTPPRPEAVSDTVWQLIQAMTTRDPLERCSLATVITALQKMVEARESNAEIEDREEGSVTEARRSVAVAAVEDAVQFVLRRVSVRASGVSGALASDEECSSDEERTDGSDDDIDEEISMYSDDGYESYNTGNAEKSSRRTSDDSQGADEEDEDVSDDDDDLVEIDTVPVDAVSESNTTSLYEAAEISAVSSVRFIAKCSAVSDEFAEKDRAELADSPVTTIESPPFGKEDDVRAPVGTTGSTSVQTKPHTPIWTTQVPTTTSQEEPARVSEATSIPETLQGLQKQQPSILTVRTTQNDVKEDPIGGLGGIARLVRVLQSDDPEKKMRAARAFRHLATVKDNHEVIVQAGAIAGLVSLLEDQTLDAVDVATDALISLAENPANDDAFATSRAIEELVRMTGCEAHAFVPCAAHVLGTLASRDANREKIAAAGGIAALIHLAWGRKCGGVEQVRAATALGRLASNTFIRMAIVDAGGIAPLTVLALLGAAVQQTAAKGAVSLLIREKSMNMELPIADSALYAILISMVRDGSDEQKTEAVAALKILCNKFKSQSRVVEAGAIAPLIALVRGGFGNQRREAAWALYLLASDEEKCNAIACEGGIEALIGLLKGGIYGPTAVYGIGEFAKYDRFHTDIVHHGGIAALVRVLRIPDSWVKHEATKILLALSSTTAYATGIVQAGGIPLLAMLLRNEDEKIKAQACEILSNLANDDNNRLKIVDAGGVAPLIDIVRTSSGAVETLAAGTLVSLMKDAEVRRAVRESGDLNALQELANSGSPGQAEAHRAMIKAMRCEIM